MSTGEQRLSSRLPVGVKRALRSTHGVWTRSTADFRTLPDFLIVGAQRAGTTSLHKYLVAHPGIIAAPLGKGAHFFSTNFGRGERWYRGHFPTRTARAVGGGGAGRRLTGEASPYYLFHPRVPERVAALLPDIKVIVLLREPVSRAYSHYWHEVARGFERLTFAEAIERESERLAGEEARILADPSYESFEHRHHSYVARGLYADQLERWFAHVERERVLVLSSSQFFTDAASGYRTVTDFLGLAPHALDAYPAHNPHSYAPMDVQTRERLVERFAEPNARLREVLGTDLGWRGG